MKQNLARISVMLLASIGLTVFAAQAATLDFLKFLPTEKVSFPFQTVWQKVGRSSLTAPAAGLPTEFETVRLDKTALVSILQTAPNESTVPLRDSWTILSLPMPDGLFADFRIQEAPVLMPDTAARFPEIRSYRLQSVEDGTITGRFDLTPQGFHAIILKNGEIINILPADKSDDALYASYTNNQLDAEQIKAMCGAVGEHLEGQKTVEENQLAPNVASGPTLRTYRIAIAATWEYTNKLGNNTAAGSVASINTWLIGANAFFEREMSIRFLLVNNTNIIYSTDRGFNANNDPYNNESNDLLTQNSTVLRDQVGIDNYNLGHVLGDGTTQHGGRAQLESVCENRILQNAGPIKGAAFTRVIAPAGNATSLSIFIHELAHQFGAAHTHNAGGCDGRSAENGYEAGGGNSVMAYQGNCGTNAYGPPYGQGEYFHSYSLAQMSNFVINGTGAACPVLSNTGNNAPTITAPAAFNIPKQTPFILTAIGNDIDAGDNNNLTYTWEQYQAGGNLYPNPAFSDAGDPITTTRPILRPFAPNKNPSRTFPSLQYILNNANIPPDVIEVVLPNGFPPVLQRRSAESLPQVARTLPFRVTVRDNVGGVNDATTVLTVDGNSGPFRVTAPNTTVTWAGGSMQTVTWDVANTTNAPVSAANVKISLSTDGGQTFPTVLAASVPNNGTNNVAIPNGIGTTTARIKVEAVGNIFFDVSDTNFTITLGGTCPVINDINPKLTSPGGNVTITGVNFTGVTAVRFNSNVNAVFTVNNDTQITATVPNGAVGGAVTLTKPACGDSQTPPVTICTGAPLTLSIDNGMVNGGSGRYQPLPTPRTVYVVNRLTPAAYPATLNAITIRFPDAFDLPNGTVVNTVAGANPTGNTSVSNIPLQASVFTLPTDRSVAATFRVAPMTISSGDFVVGYSFVTPPNISYSGVVFDSSANQNRSHISRDGEFFSQSRSSGNYMIRAEIFNNCTSATECAYNIAPTNQNVPGTGGNGTINITATSANCPWTAIRGVNWIAFTSATTGSGNGTLNFTVAANDTPIARTGTITIAGRIFTVNQAAGTAPTCNYVLNPTAANLPAAASAGNTVAVAVAGGCAWTAATTVNWITITGGATGNGNGTVTFSLVANPNTAPRTGRITVAGQTFTINQAGSAPVCIYALNPVEVNLPSAASTGNTFAVNVGAGCAWTATTNDNWLTITGAAGNGNGMVTFSVTANPSATAGRVGTIAVGGQTFRVNQAVAVATCNYVLNPTSVTANAGATQDNTFAVATAAGCAWTAVANQNWINITGGATGIGNGTITYSLLANDSQTNARVGTVTVGGQTFTIRQSAANLPCLPVDGGLLNWYRGEQNLFDAIGANDGAASAGTIAYAMDGMFGQALRFDGMTAAAIQRRISDDFTIEFWLRTMSAGGAGETDWTLGAGLVGNDDFGLSLGNGKVLFGVGNVTVAGTNAVNDGQWHHVFAARNRATGAMRLYVDGNIPPNNATGGTQSLNAGAQLFIGRRGQNGAFYTGDLDEVKIFDAELDENQATAAFNGCAGALPRVEINNRTIPEGNPNPNGEFETAIFTVQLSAPSTTDVIVDYATEDMTAVEGVDYVAVGGTLVIPAGATSANILVPVVGDLSDEPDRQFAVMLFDPANATLSDDEGIGTIIDDDSPCEFSLSDESVVLPATASVGNSFAASGPAGCQWSAWTNDGWITITQGGQTGSGNVIYSVAANSGTARTGYIIVAGQAFEVNQLTTPTGIVSGKVIYANALTTTAVPFTTLNAAGLLSLSTVTDANGDYALSGFASGSYTVTPSKTNQVNGISNLDASRVAQHIVGLTTLTANQQIAADASGNGSISNLDAAYIAQFIASISNPGIAGTWKFLPASRSYPNVQSNQSNQDYSAILVGEVTGNWSPTGPLRSELAIMENGQTKQKEKPEQLVTVTARANQSATEKKTMTLDLTAAETTGAGILGYQFELLYDSTLIAPQAAACDTAETISRGMTAICHAVEPGVLKVVVFGTTPVSGTGTLLKLKFKVVGASSSSSAITIKNFMFNEDSPQEITIDEQVLVGDLTVKTVSISRETFDTAEQSIR